MKREPLELKRLTRDDQRFTVADHQHCQAIERITCKLSSA
jgi:hypothetical protein